MTVVIPQNYHIKEALQKRRIHCISQEDALRQDIRALRIGILNIMPEAEHYEYNLLFPLGRTLMQIEPVWIKLETHQYKSTSQDHLQNLYITFEEAVSKKHLDGLLLTGAPVESIAFEEITYWNEIVRIMKYARINIPSTLGLCWGGLALAKILGIEKVAYPKKLFGVFELENIDRSHRITGELDDIFWCPLSSHSGLSLPMLEEEAKKGSVNLLARTRKSGDYIIFESSDNRFLIHLGHPEYDSLRLVEEYNRDVKKGRTDVEPPENVNLKKPLNTWRGHCLEFYSQWIKYVYETTSY
jgi:homoserine O-succinyltransferase